MTVFCLPRATMNWSAAVVSDSTKASFIGACLTIETRREISAWRYSSTLAASRLRRSDDHRTCSGMQIKAQEARVKKVFCEIEPTFVLGLIFEIAVPTCIAAFKLPGIVCQVQRWQAGIGSDTRQSRQRRNSGIQSSVLVGCTVVVAKGDQGPKFERDLLGEGFGTAHVPELILNYRRVLAVHHEDCLLDLDAFDLVGKYREGIKAKFLEIAKPLGMHDRWVAIRGEIECTYVEQKSLFELGQK